MTSETNTPIQSRHLLVSVVSVEQECHTKSIPQQVRKQPHSPILLAPVTDFTLSALHKSNTDCSVRIAFPGQQSSAL